MKYISIIALLLTVCLLFVGCKDAKQSGNNPLEQLPTINSSLSVETEPQEVTFERAGVSMRLPGKFKDCSEYPLGSNYDFLYACDMIGIYGNRINKDDTEESVVDLAGYCQQTAASVQGEAKEHNGIWTVSYIVDSQGEQETYVCAFYETEAEYVTITSYCPERMYEIYQNEMISYITQAKV